MPHFPWNLFPKQRQPDNLERRMAALNAVDMSAGAAGIPVPRRTDWDGTALTLNVPPSEFRAWRSALDDVTPERVTWHSPGSERAEFYGAVPGRDVFVTVKCYRAVVDA